MNTRFVTPLFGLALMVVPLTGAFAQETIFMRVADIDGVASDKDHSNWHPLTSMHWSVERAIDMTDLGSTQRGYANAEFSKIELTRQYDHSTPKFFISVASGTVRPEIILHVTRASDSESAGREAYMIITLKDVIIDSLSQSVSAEGVPEETMTIAYTQIKIETKKVDLKTGRLEAGESASWNIQTGQAGS